MRTCHLSSPIRGLKNDLQWFFLLGISRGEGFKYGSFSCCCINKVVPVPVLKEESSLGSAKLDSDGLRALSLCLEMIKSYCLHRKYHFIKLQCNYCFTIRAITHKGAYNKCVATVFSVLSLVLSLCEFKTLIKTFVTHWSSLVVLSPPRLLPDV